MTDMYSLRIKIGAAEFEGSGPEAAVKEAFGEFMKAVSSMGVKSRDTDPPMDANHTLDKPLEVNRDLLERAFKVDKDRTIVSLRYQPPGDGDQRLADAAILLIYGFQKMLDMDAAPIIKLNEGLRQSGLTTKRIDRYISPHKGHFLKGGQKSGSRFSLTNTGEQWAETALIDQFTKG